MERSFPESSGYVEKLEYRQGEDGKAYLFLGTGRGSAKARVYGEEGFLSFDTGFEGDCDNPGCGDLVEISGTIEPRKEGSQWVPVIKVTETVEFLHPDEDDAPEGEFVTYLELDKVKDLEHAVPYYVTTAPQSAYNSVSEGCRSIGNFFDRLVNCPSIESFQFRTQIKGHARTRFLEEEMGSDREHIKKIGSMDQVSASFTGIMAAQVNYALVVASERNKHEAVALHEALEELEMMLDGELTAKGVSVYAILPRYGYYGLLSAKLLIVDYSKNQAHILGYEYH